MPKELLYFYVRQRNQSMPEQLPVKDKSDGDRNIKIVPFRKEVKKTEAHKHNNYFEIIYLSNGNGYHTIDNVEYEVKPPVIFFIRKEQVHDFKLDTAIDPAGFVLIIKKPFIDASLDGELKALFAKASTVSCLYLKDSKSIEQLFMILVSENNYDPGSHKVIIEGLLKALLAKILKAVKTTIVTSHQIQTDLYLGFRELMNNQKVVKNKIAYYADILNTTPQNLNAVCRKACNQSATEVLAEFMIGEAKRLLIYTNNTVAEISFTLDFNDPSHFVKYFKRYTGHTPKSFRSMA